MKRINKSMETEKQLKNIITKVDVETHKKLKVKLAQKGITFREFVIKKINEFLKD